VRMLLIMLKQLNSLTLFNIFRCLVGLEAKTTLKSY